jgi:hypothetical protein
MNPAPSGPRRIPPARPLRARTAIGPSSKLNRWTHAAHHPRASAERSAQPAATGVGQPNQAAIRPGVVAPVPPRRRRIPHASTQVKLSNRPRFLAGPSLIQRAVVSTGIRPAWSQASAMDRRTAGSASRRLGRNASSTSQTWLGLPLRNLPQRLCSETSACVVAHRFICIDSPDRPCESRLGRGFCRTWSCSSIVA